MTKKQQRLATMVRAFRELAATKRKRWDKPQLGWTMHPAMFHFLYYGFRHDDCVWWNKFNRIS